MPVGRLCMPASYALMIFSHSHITYRHDNAISSTCTTKDYPNFAHSSSSLIGHVCKICTVSNKFFFRSAQQLEKKHFLGYGAKCCTKRKQFGMLTTWVNPNFAFKGFQFSINSPKFILPEHTQLRKTNIH